MTSPTGPLAANLTAIRIHFVSELQKRLIELDSLRDGLETATDRKDRLSGLARIAHRLSGVCGTLGFPNLGLRAAEAEDALESAIAEPAEEPHLGNAVAAVGALRDGMAYVAASDRDCAADVLHAPMGASAQR